MQQVETGQDRGWNAIVGLIGIVLMLTIVLIPLGLVTFGLWAKGTKLGWSTRKKVTSVLCGTIAYAACLGGILVVGSQPSDFDKAEATCSSVYFDPAPAYSNCIAAQTAPDTDGASTPVKVLFVTICSGIILATIIAGVSSYHTKRQERTILFG